ncbi:hypothetical protein QFZ82_007416 [Streptomyces sp. V4I23]|nr:hypothetical protein [Streptomyces sp. V4I23]MDQ1012931.1 hypothetical protein [Streptomyces sp. V4I23]
MAGETPAGHVVHALTADARSAPGLAKAFRTAVAAPARKKSL